MPLKINPWRKRLRKCIICREMLKRNMRSILLKGHEVVRRGTRINAGSQTTWSNAPETTMNAGTTTSTRINIRDIFNEKGHIIKTTCVFWPSLEYVSKSKTPNPSSQIHTLRMRMNIVFLKFPFHKNIISTCGIVSQLERSYQHKKAYPPTRLTPWTQLYIDWQKEVVLSKEEVVSQKLDISII